MAGIRSLPRPRTMVTIGALLSAIEGVLLLGAGVALAAQHWRGIRYLTDDIELAVPIVFVVAAALLMRASESAQDHTDRSLIDVVALLGAVAAQLAIGVPLGWFTATDPVDARTNVLLGGVSLLLVSSAVALVLDLLPRPEPEAA